MRRDRDRDRPPDSIPRGLHPQEALVDPTVVQLQLEASPADAGISEDAHQLLAEDHRSGPPRRVDHQNRLRDGLACSGQTGEVIREDMSQRRAVVPAICLVPFAIKAQYLRLIVCLRPDDERSGILRRQCVARYRPRWQVNLKRLKQRRSPLAVIVERSVCANVVATLGIYLCMVAVGGLWGIGAVFTYFQIEILLKGQGEGVVAAGFFPVFMLP